MQPCGNLFGFIVGVQLIAQDGVTEFGHVNAKLVGAPGERGQAHAAGDRTGLGDQVPGLAGLADFSVDFLPGSVWPVSDQGEINEAMLGIGPAPDICDVGFLHAASLKLARQFPLRIF